jgi:hypothetical protein
MLVGWSRAENVPSSATFFRFASDSVSYVSGKSVGQKNAEIFRTFGAQISERNMEGSLNCFSFEDRWFEADNGQRSIRFR